MPISPYIRHLRDRIGHDLLLLPGVTAIIQHKERFFLVRQADSQRWSLVGGAVEPGEDPRRALAREVTEELGRQPRVGPVIGAYGGPDLMATYPNGDQVGYVTIAYRCELDLQSLEQLDLQEEEVMEVGWFDPAEIATLDRHRWIDRVIADAQPDR